MRLRSLLGEKVMLGVLGMVDETVRRVPLLARPAVRNPELTPPQLVKSEPPANQSLGTGDSRGSSGSFVCLSEAYHLALDQQ